MNITTKANKTDMSYDFYIRHNTHAVERKLSAKIDKNKSLINQLNWRHALIRRFEHVPISNEE